MIQDLEKFTQAVKILKNNAPFTLRYNDETEMSETLFDNIEWVTGVRENGTAITTTTNPHSELSWTAVKTEMDKL
tara:strand:- start:17 stop:241 length:225 start_codon:yes stop_codon:yes gene_type:complete